MFNVALLNKWKWRIRVEKKGLWKEIIEYKYESWWKSDALITKKGKL